MSLKIPVGTQYPQWYIDELAKNVTLKNTLNHIIRRAVDDHIDDLQKMTFWPGEDIDKSLLPMKRKQVFFTEDQYSKILKLVDKFKISKQEAIRKCVELSI
jgi:hypothetical protein